MKISRHLGCAAALGGLVLTAHAQGQAGPGSADSFSYRCHLLGDAAACWILETSLRGEPVPGPYATCLVGKGAGRDEALVAAATLGEHPAPSPRSKPASRTASRAGAATSQPHE